MMRDEDGKPVLTVHCTLCEATYPVPVTMGDAGQIIEDPLDYADLWAHLWTHGVSI